MRYRYLAVGALCLFAAGCENPFACEDKREVVDVVGGDPFWESRMRLVQAYEDQGYDCTGEDIRNGFGNRIGTRYTCTKCD